MSLAQRSGGRRIGGGKDTERKGRFRSAESAPLVDAPTEAKTSMPPAPPGFGNIKKISVTSDVTRIMRDRLLFVTQNLVGCNVEVQTASGIVYSGILFTVRLDYQGRPDFTIAVRMARVKSGEADPSFEPGCTILIPESELIQLYAPAVNLEERRDSSDNEGILTDTEISRRATSGLVGRELQSADSWLTRLDDMGGLEDDVIGEWNQFEANEMLFGVKTSYDENLYTTKLDKRKITPEQSKEAAKLAREIEGKTSSNFHVTEERGQSTGLDTIGEEERFSSVVRITDKKTSSSNASLGSGGAVSYLPPALRSRGKSASVTVTSHSRQPTAQSLPKESTISIGEAKPESDDKQAESVPSVEQEEPNNEKTSDTLTVAPPQKDEKEAERKLPPKKELNPNAKEFKLRASAKSFTPKFSQLAHMQHPRVSPPEQNAVPIGGMPMQINPPMMGMYGVVPDEWQHQYSPMGMEEIVHYQVGQQFGEMGLQRGISPGIPMQSTAQGMMQHPSHPRGYSHSRRIGMIPGQPMPMSQQQPALMGYAHQGQYMGGGYQQQGGYPMERSHISDGTSHGRNKYKPDHRVLAPRHPPHDESQQPPPPPPPVQDGPPTRHSANPPGPGRQS